MWFAHTDSHNVFLVQVDSFSASEINILSPTQSNQIGQNLQSDPLVGNKQWSI